MILAVLIAASFGAIAGPSMAQEGCVNYGDYLHWVSDLGSGSGGEEVCVVDGVAYIASASEAPTVRNSIHLAAYDVSDASSPVRLGGTRYDYGNGCGCGCLPRGELLPAKLAVHGDLAFVAVTMYCSERGGCNQDRSDLVIFDVSNPVSPVGVKRVGLGTPVRAIAATNQHVFTAAGGKLRVYNVSDPSAPVEVAQLPGCEALTVSGDRLYAASGSGVRVIDITDPAIPSVLGSVDAGSSVWGLALEGTHLLAVGDEFVVIDVEDPGAPRVVSTTDLSVPTGGAIAVRGGQAFVVNKSWGPWMPCGGVACEVLDVADPTSPRPMGSLGVVPHDTDGTRNTWVTGVAATADHVLLCSRDGTRIFASPSSASVSPIGEWSQSQSWGWLVAGDVAVAGDRVVMSDNPRMQGSRLMVFDLGDPSSPSCVGQVTVLGALSVAGALEYAHVGTGYGYSGVQEVDLSDPGNPRVVGGVDLPAEAVDVAARDEFVFVAADLLYSVDVSDPSSPDIVGTLDTPGQVMRVAVEGDRAYVADGPAGLQVIDVHDAAAPVIIGSLAMAGGAAAHGVAVADGRVYVTTDAPRLHVVEVSDPTSPQIVGSTNLPATSSGIEVLGQFAYVGGRCRVWYDFQAFEELVVVDIGNPSAPNVIGSVGQVAGSIAVAGDMIVAPFLMGDMEHCYWPTGSLRFYPLQCWQPDHALRMLDDLGGSVSALGLPAGLERSLLQTLEAAAAATERGTIEAAIGLVNAFMRQVEAQRGKAIPEAAADELVGQAVGVLALLEAAPVSSEDRSAGALAAGVGSGVPGEVVLSGGAPNPFDKRTEIRFALPRPMPVKLGIYDVAGRLVKVLVNEGRPQGSQTVSWDGRNGLGRPVAAGAYFVRLRTEDVERTRKVVFLGQR